MTRVTAPSPPLPHPPPLRGFHFLSPPVCWFILLIEHVSSHSQCWSPLLICCLLTFTFTASVIYSQSQSHALGQLLSYYIRSLCHLMQFAFVYCVCSVLFVTQDMHRFVLHRSCLKRIHMYNMYTRPVTRSAWTGAGGNWYFCKTKRCKCMHIK